MSEYWSYICTDCDAHSEDVNHGAPDLIALAQAWISIKALVDNRLVEVRVPNGGDLLWFLESHEGHTIVVRSELGTVLPLPDQTKEG